MANQRASSRKHGLQAPFNRYQLISWVLFFVELAAIILVYIPPLDPTLRLAAGAVMLLLLFSTLVYGFRTSSCDPTDPTVYEERRTRELGEDFVTELKHYCSICDTHVMPRTKHCGQCNRCVNVFDHHCQWLNNCVGAKNYGFFAKTTILLFLNSSTKLIVGAYSIGKYYMRSKEFKNNVQEFYNTESDIETILYFTVASILINVFFWLLMLQLIVLHVWLKSHNLTTYEYIVQKRENAAKKNQREGIHFTSTKKSKVIKKLDDDGGASTSQATSNNTVVKFIKARSSARQEHSHLFGADDSTKEQELGKQRLINRPTDAIESLGTFMPTTTPPQVARKSEKKMMATPIMKSPMAILHDTSIASDTQENMDSLNNMSKMSKGGEAKATSKTEYKTRKSSETDEAVKIPSRVIKTQSEAPIDEESPENAHPSFPEIGECDISDDRPSESSKVMRFMDSIKEKVVFKNPLGKVLFVKSGIDLDGSTDQAHLVSSPTNLFKPYLPQSIAMGHKNPFSLKAIESPNELKKLRSEVYYINKPNIRGSDANIQLPNSCRIAFDKEDNVGYPYMSARPGFTRSAVPSTTLADDKPMLKRGVSNEEKDRNNPFE